MSPASTPPIGTAVCRTDMKTARLRIFPWLAIACVLDGVSGP